MTIRHLLAIALCCLILASPAICYAINGNVIQARGQPSEQIAASKKIRSLFLDESVTHLAIYRRTIYFGANKLSEGYQAIAVKFVAGDSYFVTIGENQIWMSQVLGAIPPRDLETKAQELFGGANNDPVGHNNWDGPLKQVWDQHDKVITQFALGTYSMVEEKGREKTPLVVLANKMAQALAKDPVTPIVIGFNPVIHQVLLERHIDGRVILWRKGMPVMFIAAGSSTVMWSTERVEYGVNNKPKKYLPPHDNNRNSLQPWETTGMPGPDTEGPTDGNTADGNTADGNTADGNTADRNTADVKRIRVCDLLTYGK